MTSATEVEEESPVDINASNPIQPPIETPFEIADIFEFLSKNGNVIFKSQQINDPELTTKEKIQIAKEIYKKNRQTFLMRFGAFFEEKHLQNFSRLAISDGLTSNCSEYVEEMHYMLNDFHEKLKTRKQLVKNRRYAAMQELIEKGEYFSEMEMMKRSPELYEELIGQYLSESEKKKRDSYDVRNTSFSGILIHQMEEQQRNDLLSAAQKNLEHENDVRNDDNQSFNFSIELSSNKVEYQNNKIDDCQKENPSNSDEEEFTSDEASVDGEFTSEMPESYRHQWGNFDNEIIPCSTSRIKPAVKSNVINRVSQMPELKKANYITAGERDMLRNEFLGIMHEKFLSGNDKEFDYTEVDDNAELDDLKQLNQDKEDEYFEESEYECSSIEDNQLEETNKMDESSDDDLDIYMKHLSKHYSLQKVAKN